MLNNSHPEETFEHTLSMDYIVIGITDHPQPWFPPEVLDIIRSGRVFSGGKRHHEIVAPLLPPDAQWIDITVPLDSVFEKYAAMPAPQIIIFASGDPLFFGFANTIRRKMPEARLTVYPTFNSLQMLAHRLVMPYHDMRIVSLTGRPWQELDRALIERAPKIGILTDRDHTPSAIARRLMDYGYTYYNIYVGEHLGNPQHEKVSQHTLASAAASAFAMPNCVLLTVADTSHAAAANSIGHRAAQRSQRRQSAQSAEANSSLFTLHSSLPTLHSSLIPLPFGLPDTDFALLDGREKMITKMPIRLLTLQALELRQHRVLWDIGFCTGSVSIEARLQFPHLTVVAFEIRPECEAIMQENCRRFGAPGIATVMGDFLEAGLTALPRPDAVFIGGHGGRLKELMEKVLTVLADDGVMVMNSVVAPKVTTDSRRLWDEACQQLGLRQEPPLHIQLNDHHPITILKCKRT